MALDRMRTVYYGGSGGSDPFANMNVSSLYKPGELGNVVVDVSANRRGQIVQLDSGVTSATATGVAAAGQVAFWKDKSNFLVTNDSTQANAVNAPAGGWGNAGNATLDAREFTAGILQLAVTGGNFTIILQRTDVKGGFNCLAAAGGTYNAGNSFVANTGTAADGTTVTAGTGTSGSSYIGTVLGARNGTTGKAPIWVKMQAED